MGWTLVRSVAGALLLGCSPARAQEATDPAWERMVRDTLEHPTDGRPAIEDARVLEAMRTVDRRQFVPEGARSRAWRDSPLPIGHGQTISQPYIVALMTELLKPEPGDTVLEVGTGSGYQAAVLAKMVAQVYTIEIVRPLAQRAAEALKATGAANVEVRAGDGYGGWPEHAPFDGILVTAAPEQVPPALLEQLAPGGRLVIPVGPQGAVQELVVLHKGEDGQVVRTEVMPVRFVPFTRERRR